MALQKRQCTVEGCELRVMGRGMCATHYKHWRNAHVPKTFCSVEGCSKPERTRKLCNRHYHIDSKTKKLCACGCGKEVNGQYAAGHHMRFTTSEEQRRRGRMNDGSTQRDRGEQKTYRKVRGRHEHRIVAEQMIGRKLEKGEIVHHINGNKRDNRPENLQVMRQSDHIREHYEEMRAARLARKGETGAATV